MMYLDYFEKNGKNMEWCKPFTDKTGEYVLIQHDGEIISAKTPEGKFHRYNGTLTAEIMEEFAKAVNNGYYCYHGWTDEHIALDVMTEIGCYECPFKDDCEAVHEEMEG